MKNKVWNYISQRFEDDGILVDSDEIYQVYQVEFDNFYSSDLIDEVMEDFINCSDLTNIKIEWEGPIHAICDRRINQEFALSR